MPEVFFSRWGATELSGEVAKASLEGARKNIANSQNDQLPDGLIAQLEKHGIGMAEVKIKHSSKFPFRGPFLKSLTRRACDMSLRDYTNNPRFEHDSTGLGNFARFGH